MSDAAPFEHGAVEYSLIELILNKLALVQLQKVGVFAVKAEVHEKGNHGGALPKFLSTRPKAKT